MNYALAKKLKDAGFPQKLSFPLDEKNREDLEEKGFDPDIHFPTLSELIEACGDGIIMVSRNSKNQWFAEKGITLETITEEGSTPREAVARLWLALNVKSKDSGSSPKE